MISEVAHEAAERYVCLDGGRAQLRQFKIASDPMDPRIQRVILLMEENPDRELSLAGLAQSVGLSPSRLRHKFKSEVGVTPTVYLQTLRFEKAKRLLSTKFLTVKEVKAAVGITSDSYFTHQFKRAFGVSPSRSRNE